MKMFSKWRKQLCPKVSIEADKAIAKLPPVYTILSDLATLHGYLKMRMLSYALGAIQPKWRR